MSRRRSWRTLDRTHVAIQPLRRAPAPHPVGRARSHHGAQEVLRQHQGYTDRARRLLQACHLDARLRVLEAADGRLRTQVAAASRRPGAGQCRAVLDDHFHHSSAKPSRITRKRRTGPTPPACLRKAPFLGSDFPRQLPTRSTSLPTLAGLKRRCYVIFTSISISGPKRSARCLPDPSNARCVHKLAVRPRYPIGTRSPSSEDNSRPPPIEKNTQHPASDSPQDHSEHLLTTNGVRLNT